MNDSKVTLRCVPALMLAASQVSVPGMAIGQPSPPQASPLPQQSSCPVVANVDLRRIARQQRPLRAPAAPASADSRLAEVVIPPTAARRPPRDAPIVIRVRLPSGGLSIRDERALVWRETDGSWWGWRVVLNDGPPSPHPPPPPGSPEEAQRRRDTAEGYPWIYEPYPPFEGRLDAAQSARLEAAYSDPCRRLEPDNWPWEIPLIRRENGSRTHRCQVYQDAAFYTAEFAEQGGPPRPIAMRCGAAGTLNGVLITGAAHAMLPRNPARRLTREEIDATRPRR